MDALEMDLSPVFVDHAHFSHSKDEVTPYLRWLVLIFGVPEHHDAMKKVKRCIDI